MDAFVGTPVSFQTSVSRNKFQSQLTPKYPQNRASFHRKNFCSKLQASEDTTKLEKDVASLYRVQQNRDIHSVPSMQVIRVDFKDTNGSTESADTNTVRDIMNQIKRIKAQNKYFLGFDTSLPGFRSIGFNLKRLLRAGRRDFLDFDPEQFVDYYKFRPHLIIIRGIEIAVPFVWWSVTFFGTKWYLEKFPFANGTMDEKTARRFARKLRSVLSRMGVTFVKVGQALSNRPDVLGPAFLQELQQLQENVEAFPDILAFQVMADELGIPLDHVFEDISSEAVAAASLGQVYKAKLKRTGDYVAIKIQRPFIWNDVAIDIFMLRIFASIARRRFKLRTNLVGLVEEFGQTLYEELNYIKEMHHCQKFAQYYSHIEGIYIPSVYPEYTTKKMLTMEWIDGTRAPWGDDSIRLIEIGIKCTLRQMLDTGFLHADPHSGNLLRRSDGRLCYIDFGMVKTIDKDRRNILIASVAHLINRDFLLLANDFVLLGFLPPETDRNIVAQLLKEAFGKSSKGDGPVDLSFGDLAANIRSIAYKVPLRIPTDYILVIRTLAILEGIALTVDPTFKIVDKAYPYVASRLLTDRSVEMQSTLKEVLVNPEDGTLQWSRFSSLLDNSEQIKQEHFEVALRFLLAPEREFLRNAIYDDITESLDTVGLISQRLMSILSGGVIPAPLDPINASRTRLFRNMLESRMPFTSRTENRTKSEVESRDHTGSTKREASLTPASKVGKDQVVLSLRAGAVSTKASNIKTETLQDKSSRDANDRLEVAGKLVAATRSVGIQPVFVEFLRGGRRIAGELILRNNNRTWQQIARLTRPASDTESEKDDKNKSTTT